MLLISRVKGGREEVGKVSQIFEASFENINNPPLSYSFKEQIKIRLMKSTQMFRVLQQHEHQQQQKTTTTTEMYNKCNMPRQLTINSPKKNAFGNVTTNKHETIDERTDRQPRARQPPNTPEMKNVGGPPNNKKRKT